ncbi:hypothetical protein P8C59_009031 [Phyllachora maydis]|uniref:Uncharacterized protein n=1 Tax=Phyllachora maydis TaxID=1825666 RepID=A0AAD9IBT4_9PEZI|nr:hypothetical protein P8C59_009031 [Phyllachora maydis]
MAWGDKKDGDGDREEREPKEVRPFLDAHWSEALRQISHHCGLMDDHIEKYYAKLYNSKNDDSGLKSEEIFPVPQPDLVVRNGVRPAKSIQIVHEENKLFKIKVVIIHYGKDESYFVSNTSARHFFDDALGQEETADGRTFPDRRAQDHCTLMLRVRPGEKPPVTPCCALFRRCIKKRDPLCKWEQEILDNAPARRGGPRNREENNDSNGFGRDSSGGGWDNGNGTEQEASGGGWGASTAEDTSNSGATW